MSLPEQLQMQDMSANFSAQMNTQKVQPVSSSSETTRWELPKTGIMGNGYIEFQWQPGSDVTAGSNGGTLSGSIGAAACIERIQLSSQSGTYVYDGRFWNSKQAVEKSWRDGAYNHFVAPYKDGSWFSHRMADNITEPTANQGRLRTSGIPFTPNGTPSPLGSDWCVPDVVKVGGVRSVGVTSQTLQQFQINLADLLPFLYNVMIPTISTETLYLDVFWTQDDVNGSIYCPSSGQAYANAGSIVQGSNMFLVVDTMLYDDPAIMDSIFAHQEANGGLLTMPYVDYNTQIISNNRGGVPALNESLERSLGCNDYQLTSIKNLELAGLGATDPDSNNEFYGKYWSNGRNRRHLQFVLNDANLYPDNEATQSQNFNRVSQVYDHVVPYIPRSLYATQVTPATGGITPTTTFMGYTQQDGLSGAYNMCAVQLRDDAGQPFQNGNQPVRLFYEKTSTTAMGTFNNDSYQYYFVEYLRAFTISSTGRVQVNERLMNDSPQ